MKRKVASFLVMLMVATSFTGCGQKKSSSEYTTDGNYTMELPDTATTGFSVESSDTSTSDIMLMEGQLEATALEQEFNTEEYNAIDEVGYKSTQNYPISTFSADVDTASYSNIRRLLNSGSKVDPGAVRIEEMINYFSYDYDEPKKDEPFSVTTEMSDCPWNKDTKLLLVGIQTEKVDFSETKPSNLVFLIDVSGSMLDENKLPLVQKSFNLLTENLTEKDHISIVTYAGSEAVLLEGANGLQKEVITEAINNLEAEGSTHGSKGIETAYEIAEKYFIEGGNNRVILATDGDLNVGLTSESELTDLIKDKKESGIYLSTLGFGTGNYKDNKMEALADNGNGNYSYIDSIIEAKKVLVEEMGATLLTVAEDVKFQLEFNPAKVKGYRLLGYENRMLATEDFEDDTKDAGEVGTGHSVTALYEIVLPDSSMEIPSTDLKYQKAPETTSSDDLLTINIRYKNPGESNSKLMSYPVNMDSYSSEITDNLKFAAAVTEFGMLLRDSEYKGSASFKNILDLLSSENYTKDPYRLEFLTLVYTAEGIYE